MSRLENIQRTLDELEVQKMRLTAELQQVEREEDYKSYLKELVEVDLATPRSPNVDATFKEEVLRWLQPQAPTRPEQTIKGWLLSVIGESPEQLTAADLRRRFKGEFEPKRVASLRQYLSSAFGLVVKTNNKFRLTKKGKAELAKLKKSNGG